MKISLNRFVQKITSNMKYIVLVGDGMSDYPITDLNNKTPLEVADTPDMDMVAKIGMSGTAETIPENLPPGSDVANLSVMGYDPNLFYTGRGPLEAGSMGVKVNKDEVAYRCNIVNVRDGVMVDYSAGHILSEESSELIKTLNENLADDKICFYAGVSYRHLMIHNDGSESLSCTPPHDIPDKPVAEFLPKGPGSELLRDLMERSQAVLWEHPVNVERRSHGDIPATMVWLFWGSGKVPDLPAFKQIYRLNAAITSAVDVLRGLARMMGMEVLDIPGVKDGLDNDFTAQAVGALTALKEYDLVVIHIEATDEAAHAGSIDDKIEAIQRVDSEVLSQIRNWRPDNLRMLIMPDHPTPIKTQTHSGEPVPFMLWGPGFTTNGAKRFTEAEAKSTGLCVDPGYNIMSRLIG